MERLSTRLVGSRGPRSFFATAKGWVVRSSATRPFVAIVAGVPVPLAPSAGGEDVLELFSPLLQPIPTAPPIVSAARAATAPQRPRRTCTRECFRPDDIFGPPRRRALYSRMR